MTTYTDLEKRLIPALLEASASNGHDFGCIEDVTLPGISRVQLGGIITSLQNKGFMDVHPPVRTDSGLWTQFVLTDATRAKFLGEKPVAKQPDEETFVGGKYVVNIADPMGMHYARVELRNDLTLSEARHQAKEFQKRFSDGYEVTLTGWPNPVGTMINL